MNETAPNDSTPTPTLFENPRPAFVLWHKSHKPRSAWHQLGAFETQYAAVCAMNGNGRFLILPSGQEP